MLRDAKPDLTALTDFPMPIRPNPAALLRRSSCVLIAVDDEWQGGDRRFLSWESMALLNRRHASPRNPHTTADTTPRKEIAATAESVLIAEHYATSCSTPGGAISTPAHLCNEPSRPARPD